MSCVFSFVAANFQFGISNKSAINFWCEFVFIRFIKMSNQDARSTPNWQHGMWRRRIWQIKQIKTIRFASFLLWNVGKTALAIMHEPNGSRNMSTKCESLRFWRKLCDNRVHSKCVGYLAMINQNFIGLDKNRRTLPPSGASLFVLNVFFGFSHLFLVPWKISVFVIVFWLSCYYCFQWLIVLLYIMPISYYQ